MEGGMLKVMSVLVVAAVFTMFETAAFAQFGTRDRGPNTGVFNCPPKTCGPRGGPRAIRLDLCKPENCPKSK
jgi:hypothetical protein